jgi:parallel beta-helix repeat protein
MTAERLQALRRRERDYRDLRAFERLKPEMREVLAGHSREFAWAERWPQRWDTPESAQQVNLSRISPVVQIAAFQDTRYLGRPGSGTLIHPSGLILTNSHVVREGPGGCGTPVQGDLATLFVVLVTEEGKEDQSAVPKFTAVLVAEDPKLDAVLLKIEQQVEGPKDLKELIEAVAQDELRTSPLPSGLMLPHWNLWDSRVLKEESRVLAWGYPEDKPREQLPRLTLSRGPIFTFEPIEKPKYLFIDKLFTIPGISGGPVVDPKTDLIVGVVCGRSIPTTKPAKEELTKALLVNEIQELLQKAPQRLNRYPVADFTWSPRNPKVGATVTFDASSSSDFDGSIVQYEWDFNGDGKPDATGKQASFTVRSLEDLQKVTLKVIDNEGAPNSRTKRVILLRTRTCIARIGEREFTSIQEAIEKAQPGDTIVISEGQCQEDLRIVGKQDLTLKGAGRDKTTLFGFGGAPVIKIQDSQRITIEGLTIRDGLVGLEVLRSTKIVIRQNAVVQNLGRGISLLDSSGVKIEQNVIEANGEEGLQVRGAPPGEAVEVRANKILRNEQGGVLIRETVGTAYTLKVVLTGNEIKENELVGVAITHFSTAQISGGQIADTKADAKGRFGIGLEIDSSRYEAVTVAAITVFRNASIGIEVKGQSHVMVSSCQVFDNDWGLFGRDSAQMRLQNTQLFSNRYDGLVMAHQTQASLANSKISNNRRNGLSVLLMSQVQVNLIDSEVSGNKKDGLIVQGQTQVTLVNSVVSNNRRSGLFTWSQAQVNLNNSEISNNGRDGLEMLGGWAQVNLSQFHNNKGCGISGGDLIFGWGNRFSSNGLNACGTDAWRLSRTLPDKPHSRPRVNVPEDVPTIQGAIDLLTDGGTITITAGTYDETLEIINLSLALRVAGGDQVHLASQGRGAAILLFSEAVSKVHLERLKVGPGSSLYIGGHVTVNLTNVQIFGNWPGLYVTGSAQVNLANSQLSDNGVGLFAEYSARVSLINSRLSGNREGIAVTNQAQVSLVNSQLSDNGIGLFVWGQAQMHLINSLILRSREDGLFMRNQAWVEVRNSIIEGNGTDYACLRVDIICNGIEEWEEAQLTLSNSIIKDNTDWGLAAYLKVCGYDRGNFTGKAVFEGEKNVIEGNNKSGNQNGMGNPGNHPWNRPGVPDGQVCLP